MAKELITTAKRFGIRVSAGHTMSTIEQLFESITWGVGSVCHTFNAMSPLHHREPGVVGGALLYDDLFTEIICDGIHIHPEVVKLLFKVKPHDKVVAITDSVALNGMPDGTYGRRMVRGKLIANQRHHHCRKLSHYGSSSEKHGQLGHRAPQGDQKRGGKSVAVGLTDRESSRRACGPTFCALTKTLTSRYMLKELMKLATSRWLLFCSKAYNDGFKEESAKNSQNIVKEGKRNSFYFRELIT